MQATAVPNVAADDIQKFDTGKDHAVIPMLSQGSNTVRDQKDHTGLPVVGCMPGCAKEHDHTYEQDFSKNFQDPLEQRAGYFKDFNAELDQKLAANPNGTDIKFTCNHQSYDLCTFGKKGTPIDLSTSAQIDGFQDTAFKFGYSPIYPKDQRKYKEAGQQYQIVLKGQPEDNKLETSTINLFDKHIEKATLHGLQTHFHSPSEHSIDGKLMDLEMHIVHQLQPELTSGEGKSQFSHGVLGFLFKAVKDDYFMTNNADDFHDRFLHTMVTDQVWQKIDMTEFVAKLSFNRRWTYPGSLTTTPFSEGILWNVVEQVIPIRQSTLDLFLEYKKIEQDTVFAHFANDQEKAKCAEMRKAEPDNIKPFTNANGEEFFRFALCNRVVQDVNDRPVYHIDKN